MLKGSRSYPRPSGVTLVELVIAMAITAVIALLATQTFVAFAREDSSRRKVASVQGNTRFTLDTLTREFRNASLGAGSGRVWTASGPGRVARPAVQIFSNIGGPGSLDLGSTTALGQPLAGTDALLVVEAVGDERSATVGELTAATVGMPRAFRVTTTTTRTADGEVRPLTPGQRILVGDYLDASWAVLYAVDASIPQVTVAQDLVLPGTQIPRLPAGAMIRRARARLYYVDTLNQLVRMELNVPRAPATLDEIVGREVIARGVENLQIGCEMATQDGVPAPYTAALAASHPISAESLALFTFGSGGGPMLQADDPSAGSVSNLRAIVLDVVARSATPLVGPAVGDPPVALDGVTLGTSTTPYVRRAYQLALAVRNTSLGDL